MIAVDPRLSNVAAKAHEWLPINPGTDGALAGAIAHVLLTEGLWNREFVGDFKDGKNLFVAGKPVDEAAFAEKETYGLVKWWNLELKDQHAGLGREGIADPGRADRARGARDGQGGAEDRGLDGPGRGDEPARHLRRDGGTRAQRPAGLDRRRGRRLAEPSGPPLGAFPKSDAYVDDARQDRRQGQEARRPRRQGHAGDDERAGPAAAW